MSTISIAGGTQDLEYDFETCLARLYATDLVNELFDQFDHNPYAPEVLTEEILQLQASVDPHFAHALSPWDQPEDYRDAPYEPYATSLRSTQELSRAAAVAAALPPAPPPADHSGLDYRLLFGMACASLFSTFFLWMLSHFYLTRQLAAIPPAAVVTQPTPDPQTVAFANYLDQALDVAGKANFPPASQPAPVAANPQVANPAPGLPVAAAPGEKPVERVYIPVYQPTAPRPMATTVTSLPAPPTAGIPLPPPPGVRPPASLSRYVPTPGQPNPVAPKPRPTTMAAVVPIVPAAPKPRPTALARPGATRPMTTAANGGMILGNTTLIGVMELGERSTALIETNGATQRLSVGQSLGTTGWQVVQIVDQKVVIQRGGELRSLAVGQQF